MRFRLFFLITLCFSFAACDNRSLVVTDDGKTANTEDCVELINQLKYNNKVINNELDSFKILIADYKQYVELLGEIDEELRYIAATNQIITLDNEKLDFFDNGDRIKANLKSLDMSIQEAKDRVKRLENTIRNQRYENKELEKERKFQLEQIVILKSTIEEKENTISRLKIELEAKKEEVSIKQDIIEDQEVVINDLSKKHVVLISKKEEKVLRFIGDRVLLPCKEKDVELISNHPVGSYKKVEEGLSKPWRSALVIQDYQSFWENSKFLVLKLNTRRDLVY